MAQRLVMTFHAVSIRGLSDDADSDSGRSAFSHGCQRGGSRSVAGGELAMGLDLAELVDDAVIWNGLLACVTVGRGALVRGLLLGLVTTAAHAAAIWLNLSVSVGPLARREGKQ